MSARHHSHRWYRGVCSRCSTRVEWPGARESCAARPQLVRGATERPRRDTWGSKGRASTPGHPELYEWAGRTQTLAQWSAETGVPLDRIHQRKWAGWPLEAAITRPVGERVPGRTVQLRANVMREDAAQLRAVATVRGTTPSALIRLAVEAWLRTRVNDEAAE